VCRPAADGNVVKYDDDDGLRTRRSGGEVLLSLRREGDDKAMKIGNRIIGRKTFIWYGVLGVAVAAVASFGLDSIYGTSSASSATARTVTVERGTVQSSVSASGNVSAATSDSVNFETSGTLTAVDVTAGQTVTAGQVLGTLDPTDAQAALTSAQAALSAAEYTLTSARDGGTTAQLKQNQASMATAQNQLTSDQEQLTTDEGDLTTAQNQLTSDEALGCPAATSSSSSSGSGASGLGAQDTATTGAGSSVTDTAVSLTGTVDTGGAPTNYYFEYGTTTAYGSITPTATATPGASPDVSVSATVTGLTPDTTYLYALVAGSSVGIGQTVKTAQSACVVDQQTITTDQQTVARDKATLSAQQTSIAATSAGAAVVPSTVAEDQAQVLQDQNTVATDQKALNETTLTAPISGTVTAVNDSVGDSVSGSGTSSDTGSSSAASSSTGSSASSGFGGSGSATTGSATTGSATTGSATTGSATTGSSSTSSTAFVTIENLGGLEVVAGYAEADIAKMKVGETATATLPALPSTDVTGTVSAVAPTSTVVSNVVTYDVTIALESPPSTVKVGMTADVSVVVQTVSNTLELPSAAITTTGPISTVTVLASGKKTVTRVTTGVVGDSTTQVLSGVKVGQVVVEPVASVSASTTGSTSTGGLGGGLTGGGGFGGGGFGGGGFTRGGG
jgi:multidrug efflux pump subunit AcrA (membrane-fusion protein)